MSGESPNPDAITFTATRDGKPTQHALDIVYDDQAESIYARLFWFNTATQAWARNFSVQTQELCVPSAITRKGGPEAMVEHLVQFYNAVLAALFPNEQQPTGPFPPEQDPDGLAARTRELFLQYRVESVDGVLKLVK